MYAVITMNSFDPEIPVYLFETEEEAVGKLRELWKQETDYEKLLGNTVEAYTSADGWYGKIIVRYPDHESVTKYHIGVVKG